MKAPEPTGSAGSNPAAPVSVCRFCGETPPASAYQCRRCGKVEDRIPYSIIGCRCLAAAHLCDDCLTMQPAAAALARLRA